MQSVNRLVILLCLSIITTIKVFGQIDLSFPSVKAMTPEAASLGKFQDMPVSYYSGLVNISIPLFEIKIDGLTVPVSMDYHSSGIRASEEASFVGLGWSLNAGGRISRTIKDADDFLHNGWDPEHPYYRNGYYYADSLRWIYEYNMMHYSAYELYGQSSAGAYVSIGLRKVEDTEPDLFFYSMPGNSGKFLLNRNKGAVLFDASQNLRIQPQTDPSGVSFSIDDAYGNRYVFEDAEKTKAFHSSGYLNKNGTVSGRYDESTDGWTQWVWGWGEDPDPAPVQAYEYVSSWCLSEIITANNRHIRFYYETEHQYLPVQESLEKVFKTDYTYAAAEHRYTKSEIENTVSKRLSRIEYDGGSLVFDCSARYDIKGTSGHPCKKLDYIRQYDSSGNLLRTVGFEYDYFNSGYMNTDYRNVFMRLKLERITDSTTDNAYEFSYSEDYSLPAKNTKNTDYWGYYNGKNYGADYAIGIWCNNRMYPGVTKEANLLYAKTGTLTSITHPTGGVSRFEYELHEFSPWFWYNTNSLAESSCDRISRFAVSTCNCPDAGYGLPADTTVTIEVNGSAELELYCILESDSGEKDTYFGYHLGFGRLVKTDGTYHRTLYDTFPSLWEGYGGAGSYYETGLKRYTLSEGTYSFFTGDLPLDVVATWVVKITDTTPPSQASGPSYERGGGLRIRSVSHNGKRRSYSYSQGRLQTEPRLYYFRTQKIEGVMRPTVVTLTESKSPMSTFQNGYSVGYVCVTECTDSLSIPVETSYSYVNEPECELLDDNFPEGPVLIRYDNGRLVETEILEDGDQVLRERNTFQITHPVPRVEGLLDRSGSMSPNEYLLYEYDIELPMLKEKERMRTDRSGCSQTQVTRYTYNSNSLLSQSMTACGDTLLNIFRYAPDFVQTDTVCARMEERNRIAVPIEKLQLRNGRVVAADKAVYKRQGDLFIPDRHLQMKTNGSRSLSDYTEKYAVQEVFERYDGYGNLCQYRNGQGKLISFLWGYHGLYPIAIVENLTYDALVDLLGGSEQVALHCDGNPSDADLRSFLSVLYTLDDDTVQVTTYTYRPQVGITSEKKPSGEMIYYEYDNDNRLWKVRDNRHLPVLEYQYHYRQ